MDVDEARKVLGREFYSMPDLDMKEAVHLATLDDGEATVASMMELTKWPDAGSGGAESANKPVRHLTWRSVTRSRP